MGRLHCGIFQCGCFGGHNTLLFSTPVPLSARRSAEQAEEHAKQVAQALAEAEQAKRAERDESRGTGTQATRMEGRLSQSIYITFPPLLPCAVKREQRQQELDQVDVKAKEDASFRRHAFNEYKVRPFSHYFRCRLLRVHF